VPELPDGVYSLSCPRGSAIAAVVVNGFATPGELRLWNLANGTAPVRFAPNLAGLDAERMVRPESVRMKARDGVTLQGLLYLPRDDARQGDGAPPVVFDVHGGPTAQAVASFNGPVQYLLNRGIAVFRPNIRGSTGFGHTYATLDDREKRLDSIRDLVDMLAFFRDDGRVDADRAIVRGGSYGGYAVNAVLANHPDAFLAGVSLFGVADWVTALEVASPALKASDIIEYGDIREERWQQFYGKYSPIRQADRITVPVLYSHGVNDQRVDIYETEAMVRTLRGNGIEAPYIRFRDEGHGWRKLANRLFYYRREAEFLEGQFGLDDDAEGTAGAG
jgi:dipeptidyl aminopeptidase/acylaminoacyl peptidase